MHPFDDKDDKKEFQAGGSEYESGPGQLSRESPDEETEGEPSEEELAADVEAFNRAEGVPEFPDDEEGEKIPDLSRPRWMALVISCLFGTLLGVAIAALLAGDLPRPRQVPAFFIFFLVLAPLFSSLEHWLFVLRPESVAKKMKDEQENLVDAEPIQHEKPVGSEPIHPE